MVDSKHGGEKMYLQMFIEMAAHDKELLKVVNLPFLKEKLANASSMYVVFGLGEK